MINVRIDKATGRAVMTADNESRSELADAIRRNGYNGGEGYVAEALHECYEIREADDIPDAWCCDGLFLIDSDGIEYPDNGQFIVRRDALIWQFADYVTASPWERLRDRGRVEWESIVDSDYVPAALPIETVKRYLPGGDKVGELIWIDAATFSGADESAILRAWPELMARNGDSDILETGYFFWRDGERRGPYASSPQGVTDAERDSATVIWGFQATAERNRSPEFQLAGVAS